MYKNWAHKRCPISHPNSSSQMSYGVTIVVILENKKTLSMLSDFLYRIPHDGGCGSGNALLPEGTKPLPEPMLTYHQ